MRRSLLLMALACFFFTLGATASPGLTYSYYEGTWTTMPDFGTLSAAKNGTSTNIDLSIRNRDNYFAVLWQGYITIPADGTYTFELNSDDGSKMYIGNYNSTAVPHINNDGLHASKLVTGSIYLYKGVFPIAISYFQGTGVNLMEMYWSSNTGISRQKVPDNVFSTNYTNVVSSFSGLNYSYAEGNYNGLPDFFTQSKVKTGNSTNIDLGVRNRNVQYGLLWEGFINIPSDGTYTFETNSDDGSKVVLGHYNNGMSPLVNNDGNHSTQINKGSIYLTAGFYPISITYYQNGGDQTMELYWSSTSGITRQQIPDNAFKSAAISTPTSGVVSYRYFEGSWSTLPDFSTMTATKSGTTSNFNLAAASRSIYYSMIFQTNITIPTAGVYTFETNSDDGSKLYIGSYSSSTTPVVGNDGLHGQQIHTGSITLAPGVYAMTVMYMQATGDQILDVYWSSSSGIARAKMPDNVLTTSAVTVDKTTDALLGGGGSGKGDGSGSGSTSTETGGLTGSRNFYFAANGDDSRSDVQAQNPNTPWRTLDKMNAVIPYLAAGDAMLLKRGDTFDGSINISRTSNSGNSIIISAYGTGNKPVVNGFTTLNNWINTSTNIWSCYYNYTGSRINVVTINGKPQEMGRYPNASDPVKGYLIYDSHTYDENSNTGSITDNQFNSSINWTGGELALRKRRWVIDQCPITYQSGKTFYYKSPSYHQGRDGFGFYIQNHPKTLDQFGEWYFDPNSKYLQLYTSGYNPNNFEIKESVVDVLVNILGQSNITLDNLTIEGANSKAIVVGSSNNIKIANCNINSTGVNAIDANYTNGMTVENCSIRNTQNTGMFVGPSVNNSQIRYNKIVNTGVFPGMGASSDNARQGITLVGDNNVIEYNEVDSTGYNGIKFKGNNIIVRNNVVNTFDFVGDDGGGIYTYAGGFYGRKILNNIIVNGLGASDGTDSYVDYAANGVDMDDLTNDVDVSGNSISHCNGRGIMLHNTHEVIVNGNTAFDCDMSQIEFDHDLLGPNDPVRNVSMNNNVFVAKRADQPILIVRTKDNDVAQMGSIDNNWYCRPINDKQTFNTFTFFNTSAVTPKTYDLAHWKTTFGFDQHSYKSPVNIPTYVVNSVSGAIYNNGSFDSNIKNVLSPTSDHTALQYDNSVLDGGSVKISFTGNSSSAYQAVWFWDPSAPTLQANHTYRVKFSAKANVDNNTDFFGTLISAYGSGNSDAKLFKISGTRSETELFFTPTSNITSPFFQIHEPMSTECPVTWVDNMSIQEVYSMTYTNPDDYLRFEYNGTSAAKTVPLDGLYIDMKSNLYNYAITLSPYTSAVLVRKTAALIEVSGDDQLLSAAGKGLSIAEEATAAGSAELSVTPNPAIDKIQLTMKLPQSTTGKATLTIYAASGAAVNTREVSVSGQPLTIDVSTLSKGVYTVNLVYGKKIITKRFVKM